MIKLFTLLKVQASPPKTPVKKYLPSLTFNCTFGNSINYVKERISIVLSILFLHRKREFDSFIDIFSYKLILPLCIFKVCSKCVQKLRILNKIKETTSTAKIYNTGNHLFVCCEHKTVEILAERIFNCYNLIVKKC